MPDKNLDCKKSAKFNFNSLLTMKKIKKKKVAKKKKPIARKIVVAPMSQEKFDELMAKIKAI